MKINYVFSVRQWQNKPINSSMDPCRRTRNIPFYACNVLTNMFKSPFKSMQHACQTTTEMKCFEILLFRHERKVYYAKNDSLLFRQSNPYGALTPRTRSCELAQRTNKLVQPIFVGRTNCAVALWREHVCSITRCRANLNGCLGGWAGRVREYRNNKIQILQKSPRKSISTLALARSTPN